MHVAYLCADPGIPVDGTKGASIHVQEIVRAFQRRGDTVTVYATRTDDDGSPALAGVRIVTVPVSRGDAETREQHVAAAASALAARAAADGCDLVYERYALFSDTATCVGVPSIVEVNAPLIEEQRDYRTLVDAAGAEAATRRLFGEASVVTCVSEPVAQWASGHGAAHPVVAPNGVDTRRFRPADSWHGPLRVVFVGTLKPWHGMEVALDALEGVTGVELTVIGDGPERARLEQHASARGIAVDWSGARTHAEIPEILAGMHVGLAPYPPSAGDYFSPLKAFEYFAAGLAVIASEVGQLPELITQSRTGILVPAGSASALRGAITTLRDDRPVARRLGAAARAQAVAQHDWDQTLETILAALPSTIPGKVFA
jgi:starch synthase